MKASTKAALLSALLFPGAGHLYLKNPRVGILLLVTSLVAIGYLLFRLIGAALEVNEMILLGEVMADTGSVVEALSSQTGADQWLRIATLLITACYLIGIIDSYRLGRTQGLNQERK